MMDATDLTPMLNNLSDHIDDLEAALEPLLKSTLPDISSRLPLLDKAKLHVFTASAIESLLYCEWRDLLCSADTNSSLAALQLNGINARNHPVFTEIARVKQYNEKIKQTETAKIAPPKPSVTLDKSAASRFIKHGLAGNAIYDREYAEKQQRDRDAAEKQFAAQSANIGTAGRFKHVAKRAREEDGGEELVTEGSAQAQQAEVPETKRHRTQEEKEQRKRDKLSRREKGDRPMKDAKAAFQDLLNRR
jgi:exosome complex protein LRP1